MRASGSSSTEQSWRETQPRPLGVHRLRARPGRRVGVGFLGGSLRPTLGLDLQGGASVILTAPEGTPQDVMEQALENIRNRVDAFGVGEPDIASRAPRSRCRSPVAAEATVQRATRPDLFCLEGDDLNHGCSEERGRRPGRARELEVDAQPSEVCVVDGDGEQVECFPSQAQADDLPRRCRGRAAGRAVAEPSVELRPPRRPPRRPPGPARGERLLPH